MEPRVQQAQLTDKVAAFIEENRLLTDGDKVLVALSGGADSVALLHLLISIKEKYNLRIAAFHFHHGIRGEEADRDERFVRELCEDWQIPLYYEFADVPAIAAQSGESVELCGRRLRYDALERAAAEFVGAKIATAHHRSDNTETVLMHLIRGSGIAGLSGIPVRRGSIIRPLLCCTRDEIEAYCGAQGLRYVTDSTNLLPDYTRNRLRLKVIPELRELNPSLDEAVARTGELMRDADAYLNKISLKELNDCKVNGGYSCEKLKALDKTVLRYALRQLCDEKEAPADFRHIELMIDALGDNGSVDLGGGYRAVCAQGILRVTDGEKAAGDSFCVPFTGACTAGLTVERLNVTELADKSGKIHKKFLNSCIPCDIITDDTLVRYRRAGDTFTDARRGVTKTVKKLFNELKIPREQRDRILLVANGSEVLWIQGVGTSAQAQVESDRKGEVYHIKV